MVQFRGREIAHVDLGKKLLLRFAADLSQVGSIEGQPRLEGRNAHVLLSPLKVQTAPKIHEVAKDKSPERPPKDPPNSIRKPQASDCHVAGANL